MDQPEDMIDAEHQLAVASALRGHEPLFVAAGGDDNWTHALNPDHPTVRWLDEHDPDWRER